MADYICVFDRMLDMEVRKAFLERKSSSYSLTGEELEQITEYVMSDKCTEDIIRLKNGDFYFGYPRRTLIRKKNSDRRRAVYRFQLEEAMIMKLMAFVMHDFDYLYSDSLYSFRLGKHISSIFNHIKKNGYSSTHWVLKADIHSFGDNVDPLVLMRQLTGIFADTDPSLLRFFESLLLRGKYYDRGVLVEGSTGAMSGCALTNFFENVYLLDLDDMIIERCTYYCRFADDIAVFTETREQVEDIKSMMSDIFTGRGLEFNEDKTVIAAPGESFELLGFQLRNGEFDIADSSMSKIKWKLGHYANKMIKLQRRHRITAPEAQQKMINRINRYFYGKRREEHELNWVDWSFRVLTRTDSLKQIDLFTQDCIRIVGSGGKKTKAKYRVRYKHMQKMGYRPLVHAYYHGFEREEQVV